MVAACPDEANPKSLDLSRIHNFFKQSLDEPLEHDSVSSASDEVKSQDQRNGE